jgi:hypothetical protein
MALTKVGTCPGAVSDASDNLVLTFTADAGVFHYGDQLCVIYSSVTVPITGMSGSVFYGVHSVDETEDGTSTVVLTIGSAGLCIAAPGVALRGATAATGTHHSVGSPGTNGDGNDTVKTASGGSGRVATAPIHASSQTDDATHDIFTYAAVFVGGPVAGAFSAPHVAALTNGTDLGEVSGTANSSSGLASYPAAARASYDLAAPATEVAVSGTATWTGAASSRAWIARMSDTFRLVQGGPTAVITVDSQVGKTVTVTIDATSDPDEGFNDRIDFDIDWGDGGSDETGYHDQPPGDNLFDHTYAANGTYTIGLSVQDLYGNTDTDSVDVTIGTPTPPPPPNFEPLSRRVHIRELPHQVSSPMFDDL